jgi:hypothetical protein
MKVTANYLFSGMGDYFGGYGCKDNEALLYAFYGHGTTLRDIIEEWVEDSWSGAACEDIPEEVAQDDLRAALLEMLTETGRADYNSNAVAECALGYAEDNDLCCIECGALVDEMHCEDCEYEDGLVVDYDDYDDVENDNYESPITVVVIEWENEEEEEDEGPACPTCGDPCEGAKECEGCKGLRII